MTYSSLTERDSEWRQQRCCLGRAPGFLALSLGGWAG